MRSKCIALDGREGRHAGAWAVGTHEICLVKKKRRLYDGLLIHWSKKKKGDHGALGT